MSVVRGWRRFLCGAAASIYDTTAGAFLLVLLVFAPPPLCPHPPHLFDPLRHGQLVMVQSSSAGPSTEVKQNVEVAYCKLTKTENIRIITAQMR